MLSYACQVADKCTRKGCKIYSNNTNHGLSLQDHRKSIHNGMIMSISSWSLLYLSISIVQKYLCYYYVVQV